MIEVLEDLPNGVSFTFGPNFAIYFASNTHGGRPVMYLEILPTVELLMIIPGCEISAQIRRQAADRLLRVEGGDQSSIDRIVAQHHFQNFLATNDPDHPLRAVGEYAELRELEQGPHEAARRSAAEAAMGSQDDDLTREHRKRLLDAEYEMVLFQREQSKKRMIAETAVVEANAKTAEAEAETALTRSHEVFRRERAETIKANVEAYVIVNNGQELTPSLRRLINDQLQTGMTGQERSDGHRGSPVYLTEFLKKEMHLTEEAARRRVSSFGKRVKAQVLVDFPEFEPETTNRTINGGDRDVVLYFACHLPSIQKAFERYVVDKPVQSEELTSARRAALRTAQLASRQQTLFPARQSTSSQGSSEP
jgi:hypothetical protein